MLLYSASVEDLATIGCLLKDKEIRFLPRKIAYPVVDLLSSGQLAQSASVKA
jgi:hypothetical protein